MATMKAVCIDSFGGPEVLKVREIDRPEPKSGEVLVQVRAASVNPIDYKIRSGQYSTKPSALPKVLGRDISGVVVETGSSVTKLKKGDEVFAMLNGGPGGYAEYVALPEDICARKPSSIDHAHAAAVPLAAITAWQGLFDHGGLSPGQRVLIHGGAGGVGHFAIQLAKARGAFVATTVSPDDAAFVQSLGADLAIDYKHERFEDAVPEVDLVFDLIAGDTQDRSWEVLKDGGTLVSTLVKPSERKAGLHHARGISYSAQPNAMELSAIATLIDQGRLRPHIQAIYPLQEAAAAQLNLEREHTQGKIVLEIAPGT